MPRWRLGLIWYAQLLLPFRWTNWYVERLDLETLRQLCATDFWPHRPKG